MDWLVKIIPFFRKWLDKKARDYILKHLDELTDKDGQVKALKETLADEVMEKRFWKDRVEQVRAEERKNTLQMIDRVFDRIEEKYHLVPKERLNKYAAALATGQVLGNAPLFPLLGNTPSAVDILLQLPKDKEPEK